ncbi:dihydrofolate reductase [Methanosarcina sp. KYL-1]|uniref:dihydrofolate reductase family protein n=1 Tax=Methanosarcina sp. KYL-1 TaxID=2602068 RepID=UPI0021008035|nr:dihydrofolate reductase family protein [Methanosarcina sp. KYL-1]MCQ1536498.1 dihydrofolate reductase [Methanosarcina sp. KYL-1]
MKENTPRIKLYVACSLDGFIARKDGSIDWLPDAGESSGSETDYGYSEFYASIGTVLMGRKTYEQVLGFGFPWPYGDKKTYVFTRQTGEGGPSIRHEKNVEFVSGDIGEFVRKLKENTEEDIWLVGGSQIIRVFLEQGLLQDLIIFVVPVILGGGIPLFERIGKEIGLRLVGTKRYEGGVVRVEYEVVG